MNVTATGLTALAVLAYGVTAFGAPVREATLEDGSRVSFTAVLPVKEKLTISLGRGREKLEMRSEEEGYKWWFSDVKGRSPQKRPHPASSSPEEEMSYWWEDCIYSPNGRFKPRFDLPSDIEMLSRHYEAAARILPSERRIELSVELCDGWLSFYVDDVLIHSLKASEDVAGRKISVVSSKAAVVSETAAVKVASARGCYRIPLGNVASVPGAAGDGELNFGGIPFLAGGKAVDVSRSWVREACVSEYGQPNKGTFGGRWSGAMSVTPGRLQFRVPNRRYSALKLLATCESNAFLTVQFYRPGSGFPVSCVPSGEIAADGKLQVVTVPIRQDMLDTFADREILEFEISGTVNVFRAHPEPAHFSEHGGGEPSGVKVHAMTLVESDVAICFEPEAFGNIWVGMSPRPAYQLKLSNRSAEDAEVEVTLESRSWDGLDRTSQKRKVSVSAKGASDVRLEVPVRRFGHHSLTLTVNGERYERSLAVIRPRPYKLREFDSPGIKFGCWGPGTIHWNLPVRDQCRLAMPIGIESFSLGEAMLRTDVEDLSRKYGVRQFRLSAFNSGRRWRESDLESKLRAEAFRPSDICEPTYATLFAEPGGIGPNMAMPRLYGEKPEARTGDQEAKFIDYKTNLIHFAQVFRKIWPDKKLLVPWGNPAFTIAFLQDPDTRDLFDGMAFDDAFFLRMPEMQIHGCSIYSLTVMNMEWMRLRKDKPLVVAVEGPCVSRAAPGALTQEEQMNHVMRTTLLLTANGVKHLFANISASSQSASYWGEQHYSGGGLSRITLNPYPCYAAQATMVRMMRDVEFVRVVPTGSHGVFALEYRNVNDGSPLHVMWCVRGEVPFKAKCAKIFDAMDNITGRKILGQTPIFMLGCKGGIEFGKAVYGKADTMPGKDAVRVSDLSQWSVVDGPADVEYVDSFPANVRRFPARMEVKCVKGRLQITLPADAEDRGVMPQFTALKPPKPIRLPGRPGKIALDVTASSDWGRVVYVLRDAKGEKFISVGKKGVWNTDDQKNDSFFNFTGTRLVRMELPGTRPWDMSRYPGNCWWGSYGGDDRVDYPLSLERIYVERRNKVMYVNDLVRADPSPVSFGGLYVEDIAPDSSLRMPMPKESFKMVNPIEEIKGELPATEITAVRAPDWWYDGRRGHFDFKEMPDAVQYMVYVGLSPDGEGAVLLGKNVKKSGTLVVGFLPDTDHYAFVVWRNKAGKLSKPSRPFKFRLKDEFENK